MAGRRTRRNTAASAQSTVRSDNPEQGMIVPDNGLETALNNVANMMANIMERFDKALPGPSGIRDIPAGQPRQVLRTASSPILQEIHDPEEVEREKQAIARRRAEELARNSKMNEDRARDASRIVGNGNENPRGSVFERISRQKAHVSERLGKNPDKAPQGWIRPHASQVASSNREPRQRNGRGGIQAPVRSVVDLEEDEVQSQAMVPAPRRLGRPVPETGEFQDLRQQIQEMQRKINKGRTVDSKVADWVNHILAGSIRTWDELGLRFLEHFAGNCRPKKHFTHLASVRQKHGESLKNFLIRWRKESREVEGTDDKSRLAMFTAALQDGLLHTDLTTHPPDTFEEAMVRAGRYVTLEERKEEKKEKTPKEEEKTGNKKPFKNKKQGFPDGPKGTSPRTSEKHKSANPVFTLPVAEVMAHAAQQGLMTYPTYSQNVCNVEDTGKWCAYHRKNDHNTEDCYTLKNEMARLIRRGHLKKFVQDGDAGNPGNTQNGKHRDKEVAQAEAREKRHIGLEDEEEDSEPAPHRQKRHHGCNFIIGGNTGGGHKPEKMGKRGDGQQGAGPRRDELSPIKTPLTGFTGDSIEPEGVITLPVEIGDTKATRKLDMEFVVVGIISNTNIILGRPGLEDLECVISPRHLCIKFPTPHGVGIARGSQRVSRAWYLKATKQPVKYDTQVEEVTAQLLRAEEKRPRVEVAGDIEEVELELDTPGRLVRIGKGLGAELRSQNAEADVLSKLSAESPEYISKLATVEELATPSLNRNEVIWVSANPPEWLDRLAKYIEDGEAPEDPREEVDRGLGETEVLSPLFFLGRKSSSVTPSLGRFWDGVGLLSPGMAEMGVTSGAAAGLRTAKAVELPWDWFSEELVAGLDSAAGGAFDLSGEGTPSNGIGFQDLWEPFWKKKQGFGEIAVGIRVGLRFSSERKKTSPEGVFIRRKDGPEVLEFDVSDPPRKPKAAHH
ncbi:unnamed protein product [Cuscuta campestris]|uniref:Retrotransposon gag domain-containing protein n=1 Tax=Cuscuta campestris TaxID=132261 RepID=A0A484MJ58_9ASTE|nr:unnamed protein product [Cuscuta campestris]